MIVNSMKKPILTFEQRTNIISPELEVAKIRFKREFEKSPLGRFIQQSVEIITKMLDAIKLK